MAKNTVKEATRTEATCIARNIRVTPRKMRLVVDLIRGKDIQDAYSILDNLNKSSVTPILKCVKSAEANAVNNFNMNASDLYIAQIFAGDGPRLKRFLPRAKGASSGIIKRMSMLTVVLKLKGDK
jgi:large subunit ribosomal protein L22